jgi:hypothetical protein
MKKIKLTIALLSLFSSAFAQVPDSIPERLRDRWNELTAIEKEEVINSLVIQVPRVPVNPGGGGIPPVSVDPGTPANPLAPCTNADFEDGTMNGWQRSTGTFGACCPSPGGSQTIVSGPGTDPCGGFPVVCPGGNFSVLLGDNMTGARADRMEQTFLVSPANANFAYKYAVVLEDPGHNPFEQPFFEIEMLDQSGNRIPCTYYQVISGPGAIGFTASASCPGVIYRPWSTVVSDLTAYIGQTVTIRYSVYDCSLGGHYGYAYIDASCNAFQLDYQDAICGSKQICAPDGFASYVWNGPGISNFNGRCVTISNTGTYTIATTFLTGCPGPTLTYTITSGGGPELIANNDFETGPTPQYRSQIDFATGWFASSGGPDLFDKHFTDCLPDPIPSGIPPCNFPVANINCVGIPCHHFGFQEHRLNPKGPNGRYAGLYFALGGTDINYAFATANPPMNIAEGELNMVVEGMEQQMTAPLVPGQAYCMQLYASLAENAELENILADNEAYFVVKMSTQAEFSKGMVNNLLTYNPAPGDIIYQGRVTDKINWEKIMFSFVASRPYTHVIIERTYPENLIERLVSFAGDPTQLQKLNIHSYMLVDDISLRTCCGPVSNVRADAGPDRSVCRSSTLVMLGGTPTAVGGVAPYSYMWSNGSTSSNPSVATSSTTTYTVTVTDAMGGTASDQVIVYFGGGGIDFIPNGNLETGSTPAMAGRIDNASGWTKATGDPDLFDRDYACTAGAEGADPNCVDVPFNYYGTEGHRLPAGKRYGGVYAFSGAIIGIHPNPNIPGTHHYLELVEGMQQTLTATLDVSKTYELSYHLSYAENGRVDPTTQVPRAIKDLLTPFIPAIGTVAQTSATPFSPYGAVVVKMGTAPVAQRNDFQPVTGMVHLFNDTVASKNGWTYKSHTFTPSSPYQYIVIESVPIGTGRTAATQFGRAGVFSQQSYVYIDDIRLVEVCTANSARRGRDAAEGSNAGIVPAAAQEGLGEIKVFPNPSKGAFTVSYTMGNSQSLAPVTISVYNSTGQMVKNTVISNSVPGFNKESISLEQNGSLAEGLYIVKITSGEKTAVQRISIIK